MKSFYNLRRHKKYKMIDIAPSNKSVMTNQLIYKFENFCKTHNSTRHIKYKVINVAPTIKFIVANKLP